MKTRLRSRSHHSQPRAIEKILACLILTLCISAHFFALGSKANPELLAYDESQSWPSPAHFASLSASEVLFASRNHPKQQAQTVTLGMADQGGSTGFGTNVIGTPLQAMPLRFEASLAALNFGY